MLVTSIRHFILYALLLMSSCDVQLDDANKQISKELLNSVPLEAILRMENWLLQGTPIVESPSKISSTCITWKFIHPDAFKVSDLGHFVLKKGDIEEMEKHPTILECSEYVGIIQIFFYENSSGRRFFISAAERTTETVVEAAVQKHIDFDESSWDVKRSDPDSLYTRDDEIEVELFGLGLSHAERVQVSGPGCLWDSAVCWRDYLVSNFLTVKLPIYNENYEIKFRLVLLTGQKSDSKSLTIMHDNVSPTGGGLVIKDYLTGSTTITNKSEVRLIVTVDEPNMNWMYVTNEPGCISGGQWTAVGDRYWQLGDFNTKTSVYVKFRDSAKNESPCHSATIVHDNIPPSGSVTINFGSSVATSASATLSISSVGAAKMRISDGFYCTSTNSVWEVAGTQKSWPLIPYKDTASVSVKFIDEAGNESTCSATSINTPYVNLKHSWLEGDYYPAISGTCGAYLTTRDYRVLNTLTTQYPPFTNLSTVTILGCNVSKISNTQYNCDHTVTNKNCVQYSCYGCVNCSGKLYTGYTLSYPRGWLTCKKPSSVP